MGRNRGTQYGVSLFQPLPVGAGFPLAYKGLLHYTLSRETPYWGIPGEGVMNKDPSAAATCVAAALGSGNKQHSR